jgi:hypothetical protein
VDETEVVQNRYSSILNCMREDETFLPGLEVRSRMGIPAVLSRLETDDWNFTERGNGLEVVAQEV